MLKRPEALEKWITMIMAETKHNNYAELCDIWGLTYEEVAEVEQYVSTILEVTL